MCIILYVFYIAFYIYFIYINDKEILLLLETKDPLVLRACQLKQEFFTPDILTEICSRLVTHYFLLTPADLEMWDTHPESFGRHSTM